MGLEGVSRSPSHLSPSDLREEVKTAVREQREEKGEVRAGGEEGPWLRFVMVAHVCC